MPKGVQPKHLLWGLLFLTTYDTEENLAQRVGNVDEKTFRKWSRLFVDAISYLECEVVSSLSIFSFGKHSISHHCKLSDSLGWKVFRRHWEQGTCHS